MGLLFKMIMIKLPPLAKSVLLPLFHGNHYSAMGGNWLDCFAEKNTSQATLMCKNMSEGKWNLLCF